MTMVELPPHARTFTLDEARDLLPRVRDLMETALVIRVDVETAMRELHALEGSRTRHNALYLARSLREKRGEVGEHLHALQSILDEAHSLGCLVKGFDPALVDFPAWRDGRIVLLCWRLGEDTISFWHEISGSYLTREPLS